MACSQCTGPGQGLGTGLGMMGFYIMLCTAHTTQRQGTGTAPMGCIPISPLGPVPGHMFLIFHVPFPVLQCVQSTPFPVPLPVPFPFPVLCNVNEPLQALLLWRWKVVFWYRYTSTAYLNSYIPVIAIFNHQAFFRLQEKIQTKIVQLWLIFIAKLNVTTG